MKYKAELFYPDFVDKPKLKKADDKDTFNIRIVKNDYSINITFLEENYQKSIDEELEIVDEDLKTIDDLIPNFKEFVKEGVLFSYSNPEYFELNEFIFLAQGIGDANDLFTSVFNYKNIHPDTLKDEFVYVHQAAQLLFLDTLIVGDNYAMFGKTLRELAENVLRIYTAADILKKLE